MPRFDYRQKRGVYDQHFHQDFFQIKTEIGRQLYLTNIFYFAVH